MNGGNECRILAKNFHLEERGEGVKIVRWMLERRVVRIGGGCPVAGFGVSDIEPAGSATTVLIPSALKFV